MVTTITLKNLPDNIYERLKEAAKANHRSINSEVIACLEKKPYLYASLFSRAS